MKLHDDLKGLDACSEAQEWAKGYKTLNAAWVKCERPDWMLWLIGKTDTSTAWSEERKPLVLCACEIARTALSYTTDPRVLACIETTEAWCRGEATEQQVRDAADAARAARAADAAARAAAYAADAADAAAYAAADAAATALKLSADIVRKHYPKPPRIKP